MSARIFIHPRCYSGPASCVLEAFLHERGWDTTSICLAPPDARGRVEMVKDLGTSEHGWTIYERFDGATFSHPPAKPTEAA